MTAKDFTPAVLASALLPRPSDSRSPHPCCLLTARLLPQVRVIGMAYGAWGVRQYGNKPHKEDALTFYIQHLQVGRDNCR